MKLGLKLIPVIGTDSFNLEREIRSHVDNKINSTRLIVSLIRSRHAIIYCGVLKAFNAVTVIILKNRDFTSTCT